MILLSQVSMVAQMVKNQPTLRKTLGLIPWGWEDLLKMGMATYSGILLGKFHGQRSLEAMRGIAKSQM